MMNYNITSLTPPSSLSSNSIWHSLLSKIIFANYMILLILDGKAIEDSKPDYQITEMTDPRKMFNFRQ